MKSDSRHLYNCIKVEPYKSKYFNVARKPVRELSDELLFVMGRVEELLDLLERQRSIWIRSTSTVTLNAIAQVQATLLAIAQGIKAEDFIFERCVAAIYGKSMISFVKAVRCPSTKDQKIVEMVKTDRQILKNGFDQILHSICDLQLAEKQETYTKFINITKKEVIEFVSTQRIELNNVVITDDLYDPTVEVKGSPIPDGMYQ